MKFLGINVTKRDLSELFNLHLSGVLGLVLRSLLHGIVIKVLYLWFIQGTFSFITHNPSVFEFAGLYMLVAYVKHDYKLHLNHNGHVTVELSNPEEDTERKREIKLLYKKMLLRSAAFLLGGGALKLFILFIYPR